MLKSGNSLFELTGFDGGVALLAKNEFFLVGFVLIEQLDAGSFAERTGAAACAGSFSFKGSATMRFGHVNLLLIFPRRCSPDVPADYTHAAP